VGGARGRSTVGGPSQGSTVEGRERPLGDFSPGRDSPLGGTQGTRHQLPLTSKLPSTASMLPPLPPAPPVLPGVGLSLLSSSIHVSLHPPIAPYFYPGPCLPFLWQQHRDVHPMGNFPAVAAWVAILEILKQKVLLPRFCAKNEDLGRGPRATATHSTERPRGVLSAEGSLHAPPAQLHFRSLAGHAHYLRHAGAVTRIPESRPGNQGAARVSVEERTGKHL
jgi:hypothetical protein